jgi:DNA-directed RNA polymerase specialized sigma24 family protein
MEDVGPTTWLGHLRRGNAAAAQALWEVYYARLVRLARRKLADAPRRAADEEDAALAAFHSFCRGVEEGRFPRLADRNDLWQVLVMLTVRKSIDQIDHEARQKRGGGRIRGESFFGDDGLEQMIGREPTAPFAAELTEEFDRLLAALGDDLRRIALLKLDGATNEEIAAARGCGLRTVERKLGLIRRIWEEKGD